MFTELKTFQQQLEFVRTKIPQGKDYDIEKFRNAPSGVFDVFVSYLNSADEKGQVLYKQDSLGNLAEDQLFQDNEAKLLEGLTPVYIDKGTQTVIPATHVNLVRGEKLIYYELSDLFDRMYELSMMNEEKIKSRSNSVPNVTLENDPNALIATVNTFFAPFGWKLKSAGISELDNISLKNFFKGIKQSGIKSSNGKNYLLLQTLEKRTNLDAPDVIDGISFKDNFREWGNNAGQVLIWVELDEYMQNTKKDLFEKIN